MKLSQWAKKQGICYRTAWQMFKDGKIKNSYKLETGTIIVREIEKEENKKIKTIVYARVSSSENKNNLESQAERVSKFCNANGWVINEIVKEVGSGLNDERKKLIKILQDKEVKRIVVEHKDRLTRFGFNYLKTLFSGEIIVINEVKNNKEDLMEDFVSIITSFVARLYGQRRNKRNTEKLIKELEEKDDKNL